MKFVIPDLIRNLCVNQPKNIKIPHRVRDDEGTVIQPSNVKIPDQVWDDRETVKGKHPITNIRISNNYVCHISTCRKKSLTYSYPE